MKSNHNGLRQGKMSLPVTSILFHCSKEYKGMKNLFCRAVPSDLGRLSWWKSLMALRVPHVLFP